jgi:hypothetical protein
MNPTSAFSRRRFAEKEREEGKEGRRGKGMLRRDR